MLRKIGDNLQKITKAYLVGFTILMTVYCSVHPPNPIGEWDDYSLPISSIVYEHNLAISADDIQNYKRLFEYWAGYIENRELSGFMSRSGEEMTWYFPTYAIVCIPMVVFLRKLDLPAIYAFPYTNLVFLMLSVIFLYKKLKTDEKTRTLMVFLFTLNPIVFYISWTSAEVFMYAMLIVGLTCWYNKWYKRAAFFVSLAGMLNPTIMSVGIIMIIEYLVCLIKSKTKDTSWGRFIKTNILNVIGYGSCYIISLIPFVYNYYNTGHINLTAAIDHFVNGNESTFSRFIAYLFDLNHGILPYFPIVLVLAFVLLIVAVIKKNIRYIEWMTAFILTAVMYSIMVHINCSMTGISRYNAWGSVILIFAVVLIGKEMISGLKTKEIFVGSLSVGVLLTTIIVFAYGPTYAMNTEYTDFLPIAEWTLHHIPGVYNPLESTFNSRSNHNDGAYDYETPIVYIAKDGYVRKILASEGDKEKLLEEYCSDSGSNELFANKVNGLKGTGYLSFSAKDKIKRVDE